MTPEIVDGLTNAWVWAWAQTLIYGPGLAVAAGCVAISWTCSKVRGWREKRAARRELRLERQQTARFRDALNAAPLIPTQPGQDDDLLNQCWDAWKADTRKETDQP